MQIYYYRSHEPNLGDDLNAWLWQRLVPEPLSRADGRLMLGIGTIIGQQLPAAEHRIIFTSGLGYNPNTPDVRGLGWEVVAVRGPLTATILGLSPEAAVTDGAILVSLFPEFTTPAAARRGVVFMPHVSAARAVDWRPLCAAAGIEYLDPRDEHFALLRRLGSARLVLADAMHAAIIADSLRVPWIPLATSAEINTFKWLDWALSMEVPYEPEELPAVSLLQGLQTVVGVATLQRHRMRLIESQTVIKTHRDFLRRKRRWASSPTRYAGLTLLKAYNRLLSVRALAVPRFNQSEVVERLRRLSSRSGFLSDPGVFEARREELLRRLESLC